MNDKSQTPRERIIRYIGGHLVRNREKGARELGQDLNTTPFDAEARGFQIKVCDAMDIGLDDEEEDYLDDLMSHRAWTRLYYAIATEANKRLRRTAKYANA